MRDGANTSTDKPSALVIAEVATRGFIGDQTVGILIATVAGLFFVTLAVSFGLNVLLSALLMAGVMALVLSRLGGNMTVWLTEEGVERSITPLIRGILPLRTRHQKFAFSDIRGYRRDHDLSRVRGEVSFLKLSLRKAPYSLKIQDMGGVVDIAPFADAFEAMAERHGIRKRPGFYATIFARVLTVVFILASAVLGMLAFYGMLSPMALFRLEVIIVPGTIYMMYRVVGALRDPDAPR